MPKQPKLETPLDEKLVESWKRGGLEPLTLGPLAPRDAKALRLRLYRERRKMQRLQHPDVDKANAATIALRAAEQQGYLNVIIYPSNYVFDQAFANAGIKSNDPPPLDD